MTEDQSTNRPDLKHWESTLSDLVWHRWKIYRRAFAKCQRKLSEKSVHESRIETRRLLSLVELLRGFLGQGQFKKVRSELKQHLDVFDPLRDTQVQLLLLHQYRRQFPETKLLRKMLAQRERRCLKDVGRSLRRLRLRRLEKVFRGLSRQLACLRDHSEAPTRRPIAMPHAVLEAYARAVELQRAMDPGAVETIHRTRIAFKKFRYMMEALQPAFDEITDSRLKAMRAFQSMMGAVQDTEVFIARLDKFARREKDVARALARFRHWLLSRHTQQIAYCLQHADRLLQFHPIQSRHRAAKP